MEMDQMAKDQTIERYLLKQMDDDEASDFEAYFLSNRECLEQLEMTSKLYDGLKHSEKTKQSSVATVKNRLPASNDDVWWRKKLPVWATAAMLLVFMTPSVYLYQENKEYTLPQSTLSVISLPVSTTRSAEKSETIIELSGGRTIFSVYLDTELEGMSFPNYQFSIRKLSSTSKEWKSSKLMLDINDMLYVDLGTSFLTWGEYEYNILGRENNSVPIIISTGILQINN